MASVVPKTKHAWQKGVTTIKQRQEKDNGDITPKTPQTNTNLDLNKTENKQDVDHVFVKKHQESKGDVTPKSKNLSTSSDHGGAFKKHETNISIKRQESNTAARKERECERKKSTTDATTALELQNALEKVNEIEGEHVKAKEKILNLEARCNKQYHENRSLKVDIKDRDEDIIRLRKDLTKKISNIESLKKDLAEAIAKVRGVTNMEWKAMEYEKVNIVNENLKQKLENQQSENRDLERKLRDRDKELCEKDRIIESQEEKIEALNDKMLDLRLQVREEAITNSKLDEKLEGMIGVEKQLASSNEEVKELTRKLEEAEILLQHAKKSWREERDKTKNYEDEKKEEQMMAEEVELTLSENMTLKRLIIAKDAILIQKSQALDNLKNMLNNHNEDSIDAETVRKCLEKKPIIKPTFPIGNKVKQELYANGLNGTIQNGWLEDSHDKKKSSKRCDLLQAILSKDEPDKRFYGPGHIHNGRIVTGRRPQTAVVKPHNTSSSFSNFRSESDTFALETSKTTHDMSMKRWHTTKDVRHDNNSNNKSNHKSQTDSGTESSKMRRSKSMENRVFPQESKQDESRASSPSTFSQKTMSVSTVLGSTGTGSVSAVMLKAAPQKDRLYSKTVRSGDRVVVDLAKVKGKRKTNYQAGIIKFIGNLDKEHDCYRIYIGVRLDEPNGDTDGLYKGKRYFKVTSSHGKFLRITKIVSVYNKETCKFEDIDHLLGADENCNHVDEPGRRRQFEFDI